MNLRHHLTVDVEEYYHASAMEPFTPRSSWPGLETRSPELIDKILHVLEDASVDGTFFTLGCLADREPEMVEKIARAGHEIASHGWDHRRLTDLSPKSFSRDLRRSKEVLESICGQPVVGYRAPSFSLLPGMEWALDVLVGEGFLYDSSMFPVRIHPGYGYPDASPDPHILHASGGPLIEVPPATWRWAGMSLPAAGGAYLRFFPVALVAKALRSAEKRGEPGTVYVHPWEFDEAMPSFEAPPLTQLRMRHGIGRSISRLRYLTSRFQFQPVRDTVRTLVERSSSAE